MAADAVLLERFRTAGLGEARRGMRKKLLAVELLELHGVDHVKGGQALVLLLDGVVLVLVVNREESRKYHGLPGGAKYVAVAAHGEVDGDRVELRRRHL